MATLIFGASSPFNFCARAAEVDWTFTGQVGDGEEAQECFFDAKSVKKQDSGHLRVWTKCMLLRDMKDVDIKKEHNGRILDDAADRVLEKYKPKVSTIVEIDDDQVFQFNLFEVIADISSVEKSLGMLLEINCGEEMGRTLEIYVKKDGKSGFIDKPGVWHYIAPEGNEAIIYKLSCKSSQIIK